MKRNTYLEMLAKQKDLLSQKGYDFATFQSKSILERYEILHSLQEEYLGSDKPINHIDLLYRYVFLLTNSMII